MPTNSSSEELTPLGLTAIIVCSWLNQHFLMHSHALPSTQNLPIKMPPYWNTLLSGVAMLFVEGTD